MSTARLLGLKDAPEGFTRFFRSSKPKKMNSWTKNVVRRARQCCGTGARASNMMTGSGIPTQPDRPDISLNFEEMKHIIIRLVKIACIMKPTSIIWIAFLAGASRWNCASGFFTMRPFCHGPMSNYKRSWTRRLSLKMHSTDESPARRNLLHFPVWVAFFLTSLWPQVARSEGLKTSSSSSSSSSFSPSLTKRPYAPVEALLPAVRVKMMIDRAAELALLLAKNDATIKKQDAIEELERLLLQPQNYTRSLSLSPIPKRPAKQYLDSYQRNLDQMNLLQKPGALLVQSGEIDAWKRLKRQERYKEQSDEIRAALNVYTTNLSFDADSYLLNVPKSERSRMIREDRLPDVKAVIASDMGMRYLYRNDILTAVDEAKAELRFQLKQPIFDATELAELLQTSQNACLRWFSLIDEMDLQKAYSVMEKIG